MIQRFSLRLAGFWLLVLLAGLRALPAQAAPDLTSMADQVLTLVNQQRASRGLSPLSRVGVLDRCAQDYAVRMGQEGFFDHTAPDGSSPGDRIQAAGYSPRTWGENIAAGQQSAAAVMTAWMNSSGHAANILNASFTQIGIGVASGGPYGIYWVQNFGTPFGSAPADTAPRLSRLTPATGSTGAQLTLEGTGLGSPGSVTIGGTQVVIDQWTSTRAVVRVPSGATGPVMLTNAQGISNTLSYGSGSVTPPPTAGAPRLFGLRRRWGPSGSTVRLAGTGFGASQGQVLVQNANAVVVSWTNTLIVVRIEGPNRGRHIVSVRRADGQTSNERWFLQTR